MVGVVWRGVAAQLAHPSRYAIFLPPAPGRCLMKSWWVGGSGRSVGVVGRPVGLGSVDRDSAAVEERRQHPRWTKGRRDGPPAMDGVCPHGAPRRTTYLGDPRLQQVLDPRFLRCGTRAVVVVVVGGGDRASRQSALTAPTESDEHVGASASGSERA